MTYGKTYPERTRSRPCNPERLPGAARPATVASDPERARRGLCVGEVCGGLCVASEGQDEGPGEGDRAGCLGA